MSKGTVCKVIIIGTLGRDPEMRHMPNGNAVCSVSVATNEGYKDRNTGQQVDRTEWHRLEAFGRTAEVMGEFLKKGSRAYFEGKLRTDEYEKDGIKRYSTKVIVSEMTMMDSRPPQQDGMGGGYGQQAPQPAAQPSPTPQAPYGQPQQPTMAPYGQQPQPAQPYPDEHPQAPYGQQPQQAPVAPYASSNISNDDSLPH